MKKEYTKWTDRRHSQGTVQPQIFLLLELIALLMCCWVVSVFDNIFFNVFAVAVALYLFMSSSLPRFREVLDRQKFSEYD